MNNNIAHFETLNITVALKFWDAHWANKGIKLHCDNMATWLKFCTMTGLGMPLWLFR